LTTSVAVEGKSYRCRLQHSDIIESGITTLQVTDMTERDTYKYHLKKGNKIIHVGVTNDLNRREAEHQKSFPGTEIHSVGRRTTRESALKWERENARKTEKQS
jgi:predicted GIY-YIG superfamily endonuclease